MRVEVEAEFTADFELRTRGCTSAADCITRFRTTAKGSARSTTSPWPYACCRQRGIERVAIVDLDVHHGNGTAFIFESDPRVFTFSMHQQHNYPMWKPRGSLDIGLPDGAHDETFLRRARARAAGGDGPSSRSACSTWPAPIRTKTISSAGCG